MRRRAVSSRRTSGRRPERRVESGARERHVFEARVAYVHNEQRVARSGRQQRPDDWRRIGCCRELVARNARVHFHCDRFGRFCEWSTASVGKYSNTSILNTFFEYSVFIFE